MSYQFSSNRSTPSSYSSQNYLPTNNQFLPKTTQMAKSSIQNNLKNNQSTPASTNHTEKPPFFLNTPSKRNPRMSQTGPFQPTLAANKVFQHHKPYQSKPFQSKIQNKSQYVKHYEPKNYQNKSFQSKNYQFKHGQSKQYQSKFLEFKALQKTVDSKGYESSTQLGQNYRLNKSQFFKNKHSDKEQPWNKSSISKKKGFTLANFKKIKDLGNGKYGQVSLVQQKSTGFICALKMVEKKLLKAQQITDQFIRQLKIQTYLNHANIIKMYGFFDDETHIYIILQVGTGGQLYHQLRKSQPLAQFKAAGYMKQICEAVNQIHSLKIIHRDIKPQNIVLHDVIIFNRQGIIKLCDFGWSVYHDNRLRTTFCGTPLYVCPQILKGKEYDEKIDIWSIGIMMYEMLVGENPFKITKQQQLIKIVKDEISIPSYVVVSRQARDFLDKCLKKNPADRVHIKQLLNHDFFIKHAHAQKELQKQKKNKLL